MNFTGLGSGILSDPFQITQKSEFDQMSNFGASTPVFVGSGLNDLSTSTSVQNGAFSASYQIIITNQKGASSIYAYSTGGSGYVVGDIISVSNGTANQQAQGIVTSVGASGNVTGISIYNNNYGNDYTASIHYAASGGTGSGLQIQVGVVWDYYSYSKNGGAATISAISSPGSSVMVDSRNAYITFNNTTGHHIGDSWSFNVSTSGWYFKLMNNITLPGDLVGINSAFAINNFCSDFNGNNHTISGITTGINYYTGFSLQSRCGIHDITFIITNSNTSTSDQTIIQNDYGSVINGNLSNIHVVTTGSGMLSSFSSSSFGSTCVLNNIVIEGNISGVFIGTVSCDISGLKVLRTNNKNINNYGFQSKLPLINNFTGNSMKWCQHIIVNFAQDSYSIYTSPISFLVGSSGSSSIIKECFVWATVNVNYQSTDAYSIITGMDTSANSSSGTIQDCYFKGSLSCTNGISTTGSLQGASGYVVSGSGNGLNISRILADVDLATPNNNNRPVFAPSGVSAISNCFYRKLSLVSITPVDVASKQTGLTETQWADQNSYTGFDFTNVWQMIGGSPTLLNNPLYTFTLPIASCNMSVVTRLSVTSISWSLTVQYTSNYGVEIYKNGLLLTTVANTLSGTITVDAIDASYTFTPYYVSGGSNVNGLDYNYFHYGNDQAVLTVQNINISAQQNCITSHIHGSLIYNGYVYGSSRNSAQQTHGGFVRAPLNNISALELLPVKPYDVTDVVYTASIYNAGSMMQGMYASNMDGIVQCGNYIYALFNTTLHDISVYPNYNGLAQLNIATGEVKMFNNNLGSAVEPIMTDGQYLYIANSGQNRVYKVDPAQFIGDLIQLRNFSFTIQVLGYYDSSSQGKSISGGYPSNYKGWIHSWVMDADYFYFSFVTDSGSVSGYNITLQTQVNEVHKVKRSDLSPAGWCTIPKSTDDMTQTAEWLFFGIEVQPNAPLQAMGYNWGAYAVKKLDMTIRGLPRLTQYDNPPANQSYASVIFGNYLIDCRTNGYIVVLDITDVDNWSPAENIGQRTVAIYNYPTIFTGANPINEILQADDGGFYAFIWQGPASLIEFSFPSNTFQSAPTVNTLPSTTSGNNITLNGYILSSGGDIITERGFYWGTDPNHLTNKITSLQSTQSFSAILMGVNSGIYYKAYAINSIGTGMQTVAVGTAVALAAYFGSIPLKAIYLGTNLLTWKH